jgi:serine/threonine protein kinase
MAPERIDPEFSHKGYDVRSDVWSLGITLMEVATGKFPYQSKWASVFEQLYQVVQGRNALTPLVTSHQLTQSPARSFR